MGVLGTSGVLGTESRDGVLRYRVGVSLTGVYFFWIEPVRLGVGGEFSGGGLLGGAMKRILADAHQFRRSYKVIPLF